MIKYGFIKKVDRNVEETAEMVKAALKDQGFGILTSIDVKEKMKEKLGIDFKKYLILGACNPSNAHKAILAEENIGLMLPCNVIIYEKDGATAVGVIRLSVVMGMIDNKKLQQIAGEVEKQLKNAFDAIN